MTTEETTPTPPADVQARIDAAKAAQAEAAARKAAAEAVQAEAAARKADADARAADAALLEREAASSVAKREAVDRKETAEADQAAARARQAQLSALIPDFGSVAASTLEVGEGPPLAQAPLVYRAIDVAASSAATAVSSALGHSNGARLLVTNEADLATADAVYWDVRTGFEQLIRTADLILDVIGGREGPSKDAVATLSTGTPFDAAAAVAAAIPSVLSLFSAPRSTRSATVTVDDITATAAVAGRLASVEGLQVVHDEFRLVPGTTDGEPADTTSGSVYDLSKAVNARAGTLRQKHLEVAERQRESAAALAEATAAVAAAQKAFDAASDEDRERLRQELVAAKRARDIAERASKRHASHLAAIDSVVAGIDAFATAVRVVPPTALRSPLATAALHQQLHLGDDRFSHVLLIKAESGTTQQITTNKPLWFADRFVTVVDVAVTYLLVSTTDSTIVGAGTVPATAKATGKLDDDFAVRISDVR